MVKNNNDPNQVSNREVYSALVQLSIHAENISWSRFNNYLMVNSILVLSWATIFTWSPQLDLVQPLKIVLVMICLVGYLSGIFWAALGVRGRRFHSEYMKLGRKLEVVEAIAVKPFTISVRLRDGMEFPWAGSTYVLVIGPLVFSILYLIMLGTSLGWGCLAWSIDLFIAIFIGWFLVVFLHRPRILYKIHYCLRRKPGRLG